MWIRRNGLLPALLLLASVVFTGEAVAQEERPCVVDINTATSQQLQRISHVGPARANQIISLRQERAFGSVDELVRVSGIAAARLREIKEQGLACVREGTPQDAARVAPRPSPPPPRPAPPRRACCRVCTTGKACGNSCIARNRTCRQPPGCACNGEVQVTFREVLVVSEDRGSRDFSCSTNAWGL